MLRTDHFTRFERVTSVREIDRGLEADVHGERFRIEVCRPGVVRLRMSRGGAFEEKPTYAVCVDPLAGEVTWRAEPGEQTWRLVTDELTVTLGLRPFRVDVHRADGSAVLESAADADGSYWTYATLNDAWTTRRVCGPNDAFFGLGEKGGRLNRRGRDFTMWNTDVLNPDATREFRAGRDQSDPRSDMTSTEFDPYYVNIPFLYHQSNPSAAMGGSFVDNGYRGFYELSGIDEFAFAFSGGQWTEYVFAGPAMPTVLENYTWLTGRASMPPLWALGYHQCRWHAYTQAELEGIGDRLRAEGVPCDALWLDIDYMDGYRVFTWDEERFPNPAAMLTSLKGKGFEVVTIVDPGVKDEQGYAVHDVGLERGVFCCTEGGDAYVGQVWPGNTLFPDFATPEAREWWGELNAAHVSSGLAGIWNDMNEPATGEIPPGAMRFEQGRSAHERFHNQYALLMAMGTHEGLDQARPGEPTFILSRAGFAGIQRYAANWMGDNQARWDHLWVSMPMAGGLGLSGQPFVGADIGGFQGDSNAELFARWMQAGALTPFCRNHSERGSIDQYPWSFGPEVLDIAREAIRLRYRLIPYLHAAFERSVTTGEPVQRALVFDHQDDPQAVACDDAYLLGRDLLVAPVYEQGATSREVYLPAGQWHDWHTGEVHEGAQAITVDAPLERIPLFARGGSRIPLWREAPESTAHADLEDVEWREFAADVQGSRGGVVVEG